MKTTMKPDFSILGNDQLTSKLRQLACEFPLTYIFYHPANAKEAAHIVIIAQEFQCLFHFRSTPPFNRKVYHLVITERG